MHTREEPTMAAIEIVVTDATGSKQQSVSVPSDAPIIRLVAKLVEVMNLPLAGPDNQPLSYKLHHRASGKQLRDEQTLADAGVGSGDMVRLIAEITAG